MKSWFWLESYGGMVPSGAFIETAAIDGTAYECVYQGQCRPRLEVHRVPPRQTAARIPETLNLKALLDYARSKALVRRHGVCGVSRSSATKSSPAAGIAG